MSIRVSFNDGSVVEYPEGASVSESADGTLKFINDGAGVVLATLPVGDIKVITNETIA